MTLSSETPLLDYDRLRDALATAGAVVALPELHGGVSGALCAGGEPAARRWLKDCLDDGELTLESGVAGELEALVNTSFRALEDRELAFEPLLPSDDAPLAERVDALASWCQGFLNGVGTTAPGATGDSGEADSLGEILRDFAEIGRAGLSEDEAEGGEAPDFALAEIQEYVRVSVQIVFEELRARRVTEAAASRDLH